LSAWPRDLYRFDEGLYLYEAKRILEGQVIYRDFFEIVTPLSFYFMALAFGIFGTSMAVARLCMAGVHGVVVLIIYRACRLLGVRPSLAAVAALAHVAIDFPAFSQASPHWISTLLMLVLLWLLLRSPARRVRGCLLLGLVAGLLAMNQQQKGGAIAAGVGLILLVEPVWSASRTDLVRAQVARLGAYAAGVVGLSAAVLGCFVAVSGFEAVFRALVIFPLFHYSEVNPISWGVWPPSATHVFIFPRLLKYLPLVVPIDAVRCLWRWSQHSGSRELRGTATMALFSAATVLSVAYNPNAAHLALVAPVWLIATAEISESVLQTLLPLHAPALRHCVSAAAGLLLLGLTWQMRENIVVRRAVYKYSLNTAFGRVDFSEQGEIALIETVRDLLGEMPSRQLFTYPVYPSLYLLVDADNPTPYQIFLQGYTSPDQYEQTIEILESRRVEVIVNGFYWMDRRKDPVLAYVHQNYDRVRPEKGVNLGLDFVFIRKSDKRFSASRG
jgi:Dolichyl-phosphate-mannose-protein mannosyltransferase